VSQSNPATGAKPIRAEFASIATFLRSTPLSERDLARPLLFSVNQWDFASAAFADIAVSFYEMGHRPLIALWAQHTPMRDEAAITRHKLAHLIGSHTRDERVGIALRRIGMPSSDFIEPPIRGWTPAEPITLPPRLNRSSLRAWTYRGSAMGRAILQVHPDRDTPMTDDHLWPRAWVKRSAQSYAFIFDQVEEAIKQFGATSLLAYNGRFLHDRAAFSAAERCGVSTLYYDTGGDETAFDLTAYPTHDWSRFQERMVTLYETWPQEEREALGAEWFERRRLHRDPRNQNYVDGQRLGELVDLPADKKIVVYFSSSGDEIIELDLDWSKHFFTQERAIGVLAELCREDPSIFLVVRSHPHKRAKPDLDVIQWHEAVRQANPDLHLDEYSTVDSYELMRRADVVVTYGSTTGIEAAYAGKPVIVLGPSAYGELGCATEAHDVEELREALRNPQAPNRSAVLAQGLMFLRRGFNFEHVDRTSGEFRLAGTKLRDPAPLIQHASHWLNERQRWWLTRNS